MREVRESEPLARYFFDRSQYKPSENRVKYSAFLPARDGNTSVFRVYDLSEKEIWKIGDHVAQRHDKDVLGRADIIVVDVLKAGLNVKPDNTPPRHANISNWPSERHEQKLIAIELAENAELHLKK